MWIGMVTCRERVHCYHAHSNGGGGCRSAGSGMGHGSAWMDSWHSRYDPLCMHFCLHLQSCSWLLQISWPSQWQEKLHLHAGRWCLPWYHNLIYSTYIFLCIHKDRLIDFLSIKIKSCTYINSLPILNVWLLPYNKLGGKMHVFCGSVLYGKLAGVTVGYTITSSISLVYVILFYYIHKLINHLCCWLCIILIIN